MILCIDSGNSRLKWGLHDGRQWQARGAIDQSAREALGLLASRPDIERILLSNVAGPQVLASLQQVFAGHPARIECIESQSAAGGVRNGYQNPRQLGVDRWCALIGAQHLAGCAALVVMAGTATTIDTLDASGTFIGGLILPGLETMHHALARGTADLPLARGRYLPWPGNTDDAITSGCLEATLGAIERAYTRLTELDAVDTPACLISGGNAPRLAELLTVPHTTVDNLVLEGLATLGQIASNPSP